MADDNFRDLGTLPEIVVDVPERPPVRDLGILPAMVIDIPGPQTSMLLPILGLGALAYWATRRKKS